MPSKKPRLTVTLEPDLADLLIRYSDAIGVSQSFIINDMLSSSKPAILNLIQLANKMKDAPESVRNELLSKLKDQEKNINSAIDDFSQMDIGY